MAVVLQDLKGITITFNMLLARCNEQYKQGKTSSLARLKGMIKDAVDRLWSQRDTTLWSILSEIFRTLAPCIFATASSTELQNGLWESRDAASR